MSSPVTGAVPAVFGVGACTSGYLVLSPLCVLEPEEPFTDPSLPAVPTAHMSPETTSIFFLMLLFDNSQMINSGQYYAV